jgi:hypothetical protein
MASSGAASGCLIIFVVVVGYAAQYPVIAGGAAVVLVIFMVASGRPDRCTLCNNILKRTTHLWTISGTKHKLCPHCNNRMERQQSKIAFGG